MKKKMLFIMPSMFIGGAERSLLGLLDSIDYDKYDVSLFLYRHEGDFLELIPDKVRIIPSVKEYQSFDVPIKGLLFSKMIFFGISRLIAKLAIRLHCFFTKEPCGVWMQMQYISKYLQWLLPDVPGKYDVAITFLGISETLVKKVKADVKVAWNHTDYTQIAPCKKLDRQIYSKINYIASVSDKCTEKFLEVYPELKSKAITVENILSDKLLKSQSVVPVSDFQRNGDEQILLSIGRFSYAKNFDNIPEICKYILDANLKVKWYIIGYGGDEAIIKKKIEEFGMHNNVIILGKKDNPYPYIKKCDLYVQPSRYEGKAVTVREAQTFNKPVVITAFETAQSQLKDGFDGVIVPMDNKGCAEGIVRVLRDKSLMNYLSENTKSVDYSNSCELQKIYNLFL